MSPWRAHSTRANYWKLATDAQAAFDFASKGPYSLEELQILSNGYREFSNYGDFIKGEIALDVIGKMFGGAGDGYQYHHIVTQGGVNEDNISSDQLQNTDNIIRLPTLLHEAVNAEYLKPAPNDPNVTFYAWLQRQPYEVQYEEGLKILRTLHILN